MKFSRTIQAIDSHTAGEATRIVVGGIPNTIQAIDSHTAGEATRIVVGGIPNIKVQ